MTPLTGPVRFASFGIPYSHGGAFRETLMVTPGVELAAIYDPDPAATAHLLPASQRNIPLYDDIETLLREQHPEAVLITLPNQTTPAAAVQAVEAGAHIFVEKPCARTAAEFLPVVEAVQRAGVHFATGYMRRSHAAGRAIKDIVDQGLLGRLVSVEMRWITTNVTGRNPASYLFNKESSGGGKLHIHAGHWLDFARWVTGAEVASLSAMMATLSGEPIDVEDIGSMLLRLNNGMQGTLHMAYVLQQRPDHIFFELNGHDGWVRWDGHSYAFEAYSRQPAWASAPLRSFQFTPATVSGYGGPTGVAAITAFIAGFRDDAPPRFTADDAMRVLEVLDAAHESAREGRHVTLAR